MKALVTGGAGFIGSALVDLLIKEKHDVTIIDALDTNLNENANFYKTNILNETRELEKIFKKTQPDATFHMAAHINARASKQNPAFDAQVNILGSINIFTAAIKNNCKTIIYSSSAACYGNTSAIPTREDTPCNPNLPYGLSKLTAEKYLSQITLETQTNAITLRYSNLYGPRQPTNGEGGVIATFIANALKEKPIQLYGNGSQTRDFIYVKDVARANLLAAKYKKSDVFNISTNKETTIKKITEIIEKNTGKKLEITSKPKVKGEINRSVLSNEKAKVKLKFTPKTNLETGILKTIEYYKQTL